MDPDHIVEMFAAFGPVTVRRLFGGHGIYADGTMFALAHEGLIYLKADPEQAAAFEREGKGPFTYTARNRKRAIMSYWCVPDRLYDDPDELAQWARQSLAIAHRAAPPKAKRKR
jgi:DNA transformation protein and related proteins